MYLGTTCIQWPGNRINVGVAHLCQSMELSFVYTGTTESEDNNVTDPYSLGEHYMYTRHEHMEACMSECSYAPIDM